MAVDSSVCHFHLWELGLDLRRDEAPPAHFILKAAENYYAASPSFLAAVNEAKSGASGA